MMSAGDFLMVLFLAAMSFIIGMGIAGGISTSNWQRECVERDVAKYNSKSGEWEWTVEKVKRLEKDK